VEFFSFGWYFGGFSDELVSKVMIDWKAGEECLVNGLLYCVN